MPLSRNLGNLTSWNPLGHSRPVTGLVYLAFVDLDYEPYKMHGTYINIMHPWFYIGFIDVQYLHEDDLDRSKHVGVVAGRGYNFNISAFVGFIV